MNELDKLRNALNDRRPMEQSPINICPLLAIAGMGGVNSPDACVEKRCAWWAVDRCALLALAENLEGLNLGGVNVYHPETR